MDSEVNSPNMINPVKKETSRWRTSGTTSLSVLTCEDGGKFPAHLSCMSNKFVMDTRGKHRPAD